MLGRSKRISPGTLLVTSWTKSCFRPSKTLGDYRRQGIRCIFPTYRVNTSPFWSSSSISGPGTFTCTARTESYLVYLARLGPGCVIYKNCNGHHYDGARLENSLGN